MKRIILGLMIASTFVISGDLRKCCEAIDHVDKYHIKWMEAFKASQDSYTHGTGSLEFHAKKEKFYSQLGSLWHNEAKNECKGILEGEFYNFASTGDFK